MTHEEQVKALAGEIRNQCHIWLGSNAYGVDEAEYLAEWILREYIPRSAILAKGMTVEHLRDAHRRATNRKLFVVGGILDHLMSLLDSETPEDTGEEGRGGKG